MATAKQRIGCENFVGSEEKKQTASYYKP